MNLAISFMVLLGLMLAIAAVVAVIIFFFKLLGRSNRADGSGPDVSNSGYATWGSPDSSAGSFYTGADSGHASHHGHHGHTGDGGGHHGGSFDGGGGFDGGGSSGGDGGGGGGGDGGS